MSRKISANTRLKKSRSKLNKPRQQGNRRWLGATLVLIAIPLLWFNERYAPATADGDNVAVDISAVRIDPANEGKLVHVTGKAIAREIVKDPLFGVTANTIRLHRKVEMYQWQERSTVTGHSYGQVWSEEPIDSATFKQPQGHQNPPMPFTSEDTFAGDIRLGVFRLNRKIVGRLEGADPVELPQAKLPPLVHAPMIPIPSGFQIGNPASPRIGNLRVTFQQLRSPDISIVARQAGNTFEPYRKPSGEVVDIVAMGTRSAEEMLAGARPVNAGTRWIFRGAGLGLILAGLALVFSPVW